jgi:hypothetical protein
MKILLICLLSIISAETYADNFNYSNHISRFYESEKLENELFDKLVFTYSPDQIK